MEVNSKMSYKTRDGLKMRNVVRALELIKFVSVRRGNNHPYVAFRDAYPVPCPVAESTDVRRMVVPWVKTVTGYQNTEKIYKSLKCGSWN
jgi:hypothetical protein